MKNDTEERQDVYTRITTEIVAELEKGARPWLKPWNAEHAAGRITRPLRHNGQPYTGINVLQRRVTQAGIVKSFAVCSDAAISEPSTRLGLKKNGQTRTLGL